MPRIAAVLLLAFAALAAAAPADAAAAAARRPPQLARGFTALVNFTVPFFGLQPARFYYDALNERQRFDIHQFGVKTLQIQLYESSEEYTIVPGQTCSSQSLAGPFPDLSIPPFASFTGSDTVRGVAVEKWEASALGNSATWWVHTPGADLPALLVRFVTSGLISSTIDVDPSTISVRPLDPSLFDVTQFKGCKAPTPPVVYSVSGFVTDADSGAVVSGASVSGAGKTSSTSPYVLDGLAPGEVELTASAPGYTTLKRTINVSGDVPAGTSGEFILSKDNLPNSAAWRVALTWGEWPADLDTHFKTPSGTWVGPGTSTSVGPPPHGPAVIGPVYNTTLTRYDASSFGPETVRVDNAARGRWEYWVTVDQGLGNTGDFRGSRATVTVYHGKKGIIAEEFHVEDAVGPDNILTWHVFDLDDNVLRRKNALEKWTA